MHRENASEMEAEIRRTLLQAIERQELQAAPEEKRERDLEEILASASGRNQPGQYLDFRLPASRNAREQISIVSNHLDCAICYLGPGKRI